MNSVDDYVIAWRCWYDGGDESPLKFDSVLNTLEELPYDGFQSMRLWYSDGTGRFISGHDYYFFSEHSAGLIFGQTNDPISDIKERYPNAIIKRGKHVADFLMKRINDEMIITSKP